MSLRIKFEKPMFFSAFVTVRVVSTPSQAMRAALSERQLGWNSRGVSLPLTVWRLPIAFRGVEDK